MDGGDAGAEVADIDAVIESVGFPPESEPGRLAAALKRAQACPPDDRIFGESPEDFPLRLLT